MNEMTVATIGFKFDIEEDITRMSLDFPENTEILSVHVKDNGPTLWVNYMAPSESFEIDISDKISFIICKCKYNKVALNKYVYIGTINILNDTYAVFYRK